MSSPDRDMEARIQTLEQAVLGLGTGNGLLREVRAIRKEQGEGFDRIEQTLSDEVAARKQAVNDESAKREAQWSGAYRRLALGVIGLLGSVGGGVLVAVISR